MKVAYEELVEAAVAAARGGEQVLRRLFRDSALEVRSKGRHDFVTRADQESEERIVGEIRRRFPDHHILAEESGYAAGGSDAAGSDYHWYVDPLDGTQNFLQGLPVFSISIACRCRDDLVAAVVLDPLGDNLFTATRGSGASWNGAPMHVSGRDALTGAFLATGYPFHARAALDLYLDVFRDVFQTARAIRRCGSAALDLAYTAAGVYDGFFELRLSPWDIAAGVLLIREAGGRVTDLDGGSDVFAGGRGLFASGNVIAGPPGLQEELQAIVHRIVDEARLEAVDPARNKSQEELVGT